MKRLFIVLSLMILVSGFSVCLADGIVYSERVLKIYKHETILIDSLPYSEEFHDVYGDEVKRLINAQYNNKLADVLVEFGNGYNGRKGILPSEEAELKREAIYNKWYNYIENRLALESPPAHESDKSLESSGSGFVISSNGLVVTNHHVIKDANEIMVKSLGMYFDAKLKARVIAEDATNDLAILEIVDSVFVSCDMPYSFKYQSAKVGESVFILGYPLISTMGDEIKLTNGIVSSKSGYQNDITSYQVSAPAYPGNSGSALFDNEGNVIGVITSRHAEAENTTYAVKIRYLLNLIDFLERDFELPFDNKLTGLNLPEQVEKIKGAIVQVEVTR